MKFESSKIILGTVQFGTRYGLKKNTKVLEKKKYLKFLNMLTPMESNFLIPQKITKLKN